jgi:hypothetical protein
MLKAHVKLVRHILDCWLNMFYPWYDLIEFVFLDIIVLPICLKKPAWQD